MSSRLRLSAILSCVLCAVMLSAVARVATAKDTWIEVNSPNFTVISNAGEKEARKVADQFEQFREMFHSTFPKLRVDLGKPLIIFVVKNEDSLRTLIPAYWESKGRAHPSGLYVPGEDRHYVVVRADVGTENPYQVVYHEYTHAIISLNFRDLPVWLNEGLAEYFGNSTIHDKDVEIGKIEPYHLRTLQTERLIPIEALLTADEHSPYYNEQNQASMFYAESWAVVHYLMLDPDARKRQLLNTFMTEWDKSGDQLEAAQKTFGDLKKFELTMEDYAHQRVFHVGKATTEIHGDPKSYASRVLPEAEVDAQRALFYAHTQRAKEAAAAVDEALKADPNLPLAYEARGFLAYTQLQFPSAMAAFRRAIELQAPDYFPYYFAAEAQLRDGPPAEEEAPKLIAYLQKAIQMNPQFAPAYAALASIYSANPATRDKAIGLAGKAALLEPGNLYYATHYGYALANAGKTADAKTLALRIQQAARTPVDQANAQQLLSVIKSREEFEARVAASKQEVEEAPGTIVIVNSQEPLVVTAGGSSAAVSNGSATATETANNGTHGGEQEYAVEGNIAAADCTEGQGKVSIAAGKSTLNFRFDDMDDIVVVSTAQQDSGQAPACTSWKGRRARLYFYKVKDKTFTGELDTIQFF